MMATILHLEYERLEIKSSEFLLGQGGKVVSLRKCFKHVINWLIKGKSPLLVRWHLHFLVFQQSLHHIILLA